MRLAWLGVLTGALVGFAARPAAAEVPVLEGFGGPLGYGSDCLHPNDDGSSTQISLRTAFPGGLNFFGEVHDTAFVNTNGNITFSGGLSQFTPDPFPVANRPMIAPFWADVDIRGGGDGSCSRSGSGCQDPSDNGVWWHLEPGLFIVTWHEVGYYSCNTDLRSTFQLIISSGACGGATDDFEVEFRFSRCEWTTGDASGGMDGFGGTPGQSGFDAGNQTDFTEIMGSRTDDIHRILCEQSNVGEPGRWKFQIRGGAVTCPDAGRPCDTGMLGVCAEGATECAADGSVVCSGLVSPTEEACDALDNDCDGSVDEGPPTCMGERVCDRGRCLDPCDGGDDCPDGFTCTNDGLCLARGCEGMTCPAGERCLEGRCTDGCEGVVCPYGQRCIAGACVDPCDDLECASCAVCDAGRCNLHCALADCSSGEVCAPDGRCIEAACEGVRCGREQRCRGGECIDLCEGVVCPAGEECMNGFCLLPGQALPGRGDGLPTFTPADDGGCGVVRRARSGGAPWWAAGILLASLLWRRRRPS